MQNVVETTKGKPMNTTGIVQYDASAAVTMQTRAARVLTAARAIQVIDSPLMLDLVNEDLRAVKALAKQVEEARTSITGPLNAALKAVNDLFRPAGDAVADAESTFKRAILTYQQDMERKAREARMRAEQEAREARAKIEAEARQAEAEAREKARELEAQAEEARRAGDAQAAIALESQAVTVRDVAEIANDARIVELELTTAIAPEASFTRPTAAGLSMRKKWKARVTDKMALLKFICERPEYINLLDINQTALNQLATAQKDAMSIKGVEAYEDSSIASRA